MSDSPSDGFWLQAGADNPADRLRILLEALCAMDEVVWVRDLAEERIVYISPAFARIWGRPVEALLESPRTWIEAIHPEDRERVLSAAVNEARSAQDSIEYRILRPDGALRWVYDRSYPIRDAEGRIRRLAGVVEDITDRRFPGDAR